MTHPMRPELAEQLRPESHPQRSPAWRDDHRGVGRWQLDVSVLYPMLAPLLPRIVSREVNASTAVIEDACQFAWLRLVIHAARVDEDRVLAWLVTTAVRQAVRLVRRDRRELSLDAVDRGGELNLPDVSPLPDQRAVWREQLTELRALPVRPQRLLWMHALGFSYAEIAALSGLTHRTIDRQLCRGRKRLRIAA